MVFSQVFSFNNRLVELAFSHSKSVLHALEFKRKFFVFGNGGFKVSAKFLVFSLGAITFLFKVCCLFLEIVILLVKLFELFVGLINCLLPGFHLLDKVGVVFFGLEKNIIKFGVWGLELASFLFKLFKGIDRVIQKFI